MSERIIFQQIMEQERGGIFKPASKKELAKRREELEKGRNKRFRLVYVSAVTVAAADEDDAKEQFEEMNLEPASDEKIVDFDFIDLSDTYEVDEHGRRVENA